MVAGMKTLPPRPLSDSDHRALIAGALFMAAAYVLPTRPVLDDASPASHASHHAPEPTLARIHPTAD